MPEEQAKPEEPEAREGAESNGEPASAASAPSELSEAGARLRVLRTAARVRAGVALEERGFSLVPGADERWSGRLVLTAAESELDATVRLPSEFPDALPEVFIDPMRLPRRIAHVDESGKVCVAPTSNLLLDADRPAALVTTALDRATAELERGYAGLSDPELEGELLAYWVPTDTLTTVSICTPDAESRTIVLCSVSDGPSLLKSSVLVADSLESARTWAGRVGANVNSSRTALFIRVDVSVTLPRYRTATTVGEIRSLIERHADAEGVRLLHQAVVRADYPQAIVLSLPEATPGDGRRLVGVRLKRPDKSQRKLATRGFRPGRVPATRILRTMERAPVERLRLKRADHTFLTARGGAAAQLATARVIVVGIGAVGSEVARNLASLGVGHLRLVDPETLALENVHRHALGVRLVGSNKAVAMAARLTLDFPHLDVEYRPKGVEEILIEEPQFLLDVDLIVLATGEETLERRLNRVLINGPPRVHTWLEPLGLAGHAFGCGAGARTTERDEPARGCFECLYLRDTEHVLFNRAALTAPGQEIRRSLAGCAGTFSPFSPLDARRTAVDAAELAARIVTNVAPTPVLVSWRGLHTAFEEEHYKLSPRARRIPPGARVDVVGAELHREDCTVCAAVSVAARASGHPSE